MWIKGHTHTVVEGAKKGENIIKSKKNKGQDFLDYASKNNIQINIEYEEDKIQEKRKKYYDKKDPKYNNQRDKNQNGKYQKKPYQNDQNNNYNNGNKYNNRNQGYKRQQKRAQRVKRKQRKNH